MTNADTIRFGVEFETTIDNNQQSETTIGGYHNGVAVPYLPATDASGNATNWKAERDGSIDATAGRRGCEFISPILSGRDGIENVASTLAILREKGAKVNRSCGLHVTVEFKGDERDLARLISLVANHEVGIYATTGTRNRELAGFANKIKEYGNDKNAKSNMTGSYRTRFHLLNIEHIANGGQRVEFRAFAGTLNTAKAIAAIQMAIGFVQLSQADAKKTRWSAPSKPASRANQGDGQYEVHRIYYRLGWTTGHRKTGDPLRGIVFGAIDNDAATIKDCKKIANKMAKKYDAN